jgi:DNA-binding NtrC family response regulator
VARTRPPSAPRPDDETAALVRRPPAPAPLGAVVRVLGPQAPPPFRLRAGRCVVGSAPSSDVPIADATVSRAHAELELVAEGVRVRDLGSTNGTFYLGQRVEQMVLALGGRIEVGARSVLIEADHASLHEQLTYEWDEYHGVVGASPAMRRVFALLTRLEGSLATVLVEGESGVGKELIAGALHGASSVCDGPFVPVNCGAIPRELTASELFGHRRGAFTGALDARKGAFESADGGTLFLDEIGELPVEVQPMLLRVLETGEVRPVGEDQSRHVTVRVIAATNRDLSREVQEGRFREDLFYRLAVVRLYVPPLRDRLEDIEPLARRFATAAGVGVLPQDVLERLRSRPWPGNVRELRNAIQSYAALRELPEAARAPAGGIDRELAQLIDLDRPYLEQRDGLTDRFTRLYLAALLARADGNQTVAAKIAGLDRTYLGRLLARYGMGSRG